MRAARRLGGERGAVTLWFVGLSVVVLFVGGLSVDLWRAFTVRRSVAAVVDAAAVAGASGIDEAWFRATGEVRLDPARARGLAAESLARQRVAGGRSLATGIAATEQAVTVRGQAEVELTLLRVLLAPTPLPVEVASTARPRRGPP